MSDPIPFALTGRTILRRAKRELLQMYQQTAGGTDPVADERCRELFESGDLDEMPWVDFNTLLYQMYED